MVRMEHIESGSNLDHEIGWVIEMNSIKDKLHFLTAILLLFLIGFTVWYVLFYLQGPEVSSDGTLVYQEVGRLVAHG